MASKDQINESRDLLEEYQQDSGPKSSLLGWFAEFLWLPEVLSCLLSLICVVAIAVVLRIYNDKPPPNWPLGITLNALLALLTSIAKLALIFPITTGLGQLRWIWFTKPRKLSDFALFEDACRGVIGSVRLLFSLKGGVFGFLGSLLAVVSLITSPVTQQAIQYPTRLSAGSGTATVPRLKTLSMNMSLYHDSKTVPGFVLGFKRNILAGAYNLPSQSLADVSPVCSTGECIFPEFISLGICTHVANISKYITVERSQNRSWGLPGLEDETTWRVSMPPHYTLLVPNLQSLDFVNAGGSSTLFTDSELKSSMANWYLVYSNLPASPQDNPTFEAIEIVFRWCAKAFSVVVEGGVARWEEIATSDKVVENTAKSFDLLTNDQYQNCTFGRGMPCPLRTWGRLVMAPPPRFEHHPSLVVSEVTGLDLSAILQLSFWSGSDAPIWTPDTGEPRVGGMFLFGHSVYRVQGDISLAAAGMLWRYVFSATTDASLQLQAVANMTRNMAKGMENFFRETLQAGHGNPDIIIGTALHPTPYVSIRWPWFVFLALELTVSLLFLCGIIALTRRASIQTIKDSPLAIACALDDATRHRLGGIHDLGGMSQRAAEMEVILERGPTGVSLWLTMEKTASSVGTDSC